MPGNPLSDPTLATTLADTVERYVALIRDRTTNKVVVIVRAMVFGIVIALELIATTVLTIIFLTKLTQLLVKRIFRVDADTSVWLSYAVVGGILTIAGLVILRLRKPKEVAAA